MKQRLLTLLCLLCCLSASTAWADTKLFHEGFGDNSGSARVWNDSYKEQSGIAAIYGNAAYTITNAKQTKNNQGSTSSGISQTSQGKDAVFLVGPLDLSNCSGVTLSYQWKAASVKGTYTTNVYYGTSTSGEFTEIANTAVGATSFVNVSVIVPTAALVTNAYFKVVFNTSNTQAIIDEFDLSGTYNGTVVEKVKTPTFSPAGGEFTEAQNVTIACDTEGATIYYTTNGEVPATTSAIYSDPIEVNATTTIKAIAVKTDMDDSEIATATYTIKTLPTVTSIAGLKTLTSGTEAILNLSDAVVTGVTSGNTPNVFIQDAKGGLELFKYTGPAVEIGKHISGTIIGTYTLYYGTPEINSGATYNLTVSDGDAAEPAVVTIDELVAKQTDYACKLIKIENASCSNNVITQEGSTNSLTAFKTFMTLPTKWPETFDITGVCIIYYTTLEIAPRSEADIVQKGGKITPTLTFAPEEVTAYLDALREFNAPVLTTDPAGLTVTYSMTGDAVGTINETTGEITFNTAGTVGSATVTASFAGNDEYKAATATYTLKVVANKPVFVMLVAKAHDGRYYAMSSNKGVVDNSLKAIEVNVDNNRVYIENISDLDNSLLWLIETSEKEGEDFIKAFDGSYLAGTSGSTNLITKIKTQANSWLYDNANNCWKIGSRSFLFKEKYSDDKPYPVFRNYSTNNLDTDGYAVTYTIAMPYGPLFNVHEGTSTEGLVTNEIVVDGENYKANKIRLFDNVDYKLEHAVEANEVEYSRLLTSTTWTTICLPFDVPEAACGDYDVLQIFGAADDAIVFEYASAMVKHTPYLIKKKDSFTDRNLAFDITGTITVDATTDEAEAVVDDVKLVGIYEAQLIPVDGKSYGISGGEFKRPSATNKNKLNAYRAYLQFIDAAQAEMLKIKVNDGTEGIGSIVNDVEDGVFYDLYGRKVNNPTTGIYIFNGTKVYVK